MPRLSEAAQFDRTISQLVAKREGYAKGLADIDALFAKYGITLNGKPTPMAPVKAPVVATPQPAKRRTRGSFSQTADDLVLSMLKVGKELSTAEINAKWRESGRGGTADNTLGKLVKEKKIKRTPKPEGRGSTYRAG